MAASNWHWRTHAPPRSALTAFFSKQISPLEAEGLSVSRVAVTEGDCELGHRKGKLLTIYDLRVEVSWQAKDSDGKDVQGTLICPEMAHDMKESEYEFETTTEDSSKEVGKFRKIAQTQLADKIRPIFNTFPQFLVETYGSTLKTGEGASNGLSQPKSSSNSSMAVDSNSTGTSEHSGATERLNTSSVRVQAEFQTSAEQLFDLLTNEQRVPMWSRNPAKIKPEKGAEISLFNGNITGRMEEVDPPKHFVSTWRAPTWPSGHFGRLHTNLRQGSDATTMELRLEGVPKGEEDAVERNLDVFYIRSLKAMGLGGLLGSALPDSAGDRSVSAKALSSGQLLYGALPLVLSSALIVGLISAIVLGPSTRQPAG